jgi:hypothetical protein
MMPAIVKEALLFKIENFAGVTSLCRTAAKEFIQLYDGDWNPRLYLTGNGGIELTWEHPLEDVTILCGLEFDALARIRYFWFYSDDTESDDMDEEVLFKNYQSIAAVADYVQQSQEAFF